MMADIRWPFRERGRLDTSLVYWSRQLRFTSAEQTLQRVAACLEDKKPGAYLRFGCPDVETALGIGHSASDLPDGLVEEIRGAFLLSGSNILKALDVQATDLAIAHRNPAARASQRETLERLNAVGACFLDTQVYSYRAFLPGQTDPPDLRDRLFDLLQDCRPVLLAQEGMVTKDVIQLLGPRAVSEVSSEHIYEGLDALGDEAGRSAGAQSEFPVIILMLGIAGRVLASRLLRHRFPGWILDLDNAVEITGQNSKTPRRPAKMNMPSGPAKERERAERGPDGRLPVRWEGPFLGHYSYSMINRELAMQLDRKPQIELTIRPSDTPFTAAPFDPARQDRFGSIVERVNKPLSRPARVHIRNHTQHPFLPPAEGHWVTIQPWDYVSLPVQWVDWIQKQVDEVWVPSSFVRSAYLEAGIPEERVTVVPNGVDTRYYRPEARRVRLHTMKSFKFLFVGGPFWRKGFDVLLAAYGKAFSAADDTCLVIKSTPEFWTQDGERRLAAFRSRIQAPETLSVVGTLDPARMAGLYASCDCLVHPYRAEGFAMCVAEGMASGLPAIVTGSGGTTDFCNERTAFLIESRICHMRTQQLDDWQTIDYPAYAEPDLDSLVQWMRYVYGNRRGSSQLAREGMKKIRSEFTWDHAGEIAVQRLITLESRSIRRIAGK